jgi:Leucine-rich repeat (LRR) protein
VRNNRLTFLPQTIGNMSSLEYLYLGNNDLRMLPVEIQNLNKLRTLDLSDNEIAGDPPEFLGQLESLIELDLTNCCSGNRLPSSLSNLEKLEYLYVNSYQIIPYSLGKRNTRLKVVVK